MSFDIQELLLFNCLNFNLGGGGVDLLVGPPSTLGKCSLTVIINALKYCPIKKNLKLGMHIFSLLSLELFHLCL